MSRSRRLWNASPSGAATSPLPYQLSSTMGASSPASRSAVVKPAAVPLAWKTRSQSLGAPSGPAKRAPIACAGLARAEAISTTVTSAAGNRAHRYATKRPTSPPPTTAMRRAGRAVPHRIERGLHIGREYGAPRRHTLGNGNHRLRRQGEQALVGMQAENDALAQFGGPSLDPPDGRVAVFHREGKCPPHQRRAHTFVLAHRHAAGMNEPLRAATDGAEQRAHLHLAGLGRANRLFVQLGTAGADIPEGLALHLGHSLGCHCPRKMPPRSRQAVQIRHAVQIKGNTRHASRIGLGRTPLYPQMPEKTRKALSCSNVPPATRS